MFGFAGSRDSTVLGSQPYGGVSLRAGFCLSPGCEIVGGYNDAYWASAGSTYDDPQVLVGFAMRYGGGNP